MNTLNGGSGRVLVVGATGQLGTGVVRELAASGDHVLAFVRPDSNYGHLAELRGVEIAFGDLRDAASVERACRRADAIVATANTVAPRERDYSFEEIEGDGYDSLITAAERHGCGRFVLISVPMTPYDDGVPTFQHKRRIERRLERSPVPHTIFRASLFMDCWISLLGSSIPLRGETAATLDRPFRFLRIFRKATGELIERRGVALIPGNGRTRHAFIATADVAAVLARAVRHPGTANRNFELGGPDILSWNEVVDVYARVLDRRIRALHLPLTGFRLQMRMLRPFSEAAANIMGMNWLVASIGTPYDSTEIEETFDIRLATVGEFLRDKLSVDLRQATAAS